MEADLRNPFPGMNPYLQPHWHSMHARLVTYACDEIARQLPAGLAALTEERITIERYRDDLRKRVGPDVAVEKPWERVSEARAAYGPSAEEQALLAEAKTIILDDPVERSVHIVDGSGELITALEIISPTNKGEGRWAYLEKQRIYQEGGVNLVEIDLVYGMQGGDRVFRAPSEQFGPVSEFPYGVCVWRARDPGRAAAYPIGWRDPLPRIPVPLREQDTESILNLQLIVDQAYERGRYAYLIRYGSELHGQVPDAEAKWAEAVLREKGLWGE